MDNIPEVRENTLGDGFGLYSRRCYKLGDDILQQEPMIFWSTGNRTQCYNAYLLASGTIQDKIMALFCPSDDKLINLPEYNKIYHYAQIMQRRYPDFDVEIFLKLSFIARFNATQYKMKYSAIFETHARINHSCAPNAIFSAGSVKAIANIAPGDAICISYLSNELLISSTRVRQRQLFGTYLFVCQCQRCSCQIDLCRVMMCPSCHDQCTVVWGLSSNSKSCDTTIKMENIRDIKSLDIVGQCVICGNIYAAVHMPLLQELEIELKVLSLCREADNNLGGSLDVEQIAELHEEILSTLGAAHWTAIAMAVLHRDHDPVDYSTGPFSALMWGEAAAVWCQTALAEYSELSSYLYNMRIYDIGKEFTMSRRSELQTAGRRYLLICYEYLKQLWGFDDPDVVYMERIFKNCRDYGEFVNKPLCCYGLCQTPATKHSTVTLTCSECQLATYCNNSCQEADKSSHKLLCRPCSASKDMEIVSNAMLTTYLSIKSV